MLKQSYNIKYTLLFQNYYYINPNILENGYFDLTATQAPPPPPLLPLLKNGPHPKIYFFYVSDDILFTKNNLFFFNIRVI